MALAQAGRPSTLRDLLISCDVMQTARSSQVDTPHQRHSGPNQHSPSHSHQQNHAPGHPDQRQQSHRHHQQPPQEHPKQQQGHNPAPQPLRPLPDFFLDGGVPDPRSASVADIGEVEASAGRVQTSAERGGGAEAPSSRSARTRKDSKKKPSPREQPAGVRGSGREDVLQGRGDDGVGEDDGYQLEVTVYSHRLVGEGYSSHTEYTVLANASLPGFARREMEVSRR